MSNSYDPKDPNRNTLMIQAALMHFEQGEHSIDIAGLLNQSGCPALKSVALVESAMKIMECHDEIKNCQDEIKQCQDEIEQLLKGEV